jgi:hypothetical protein
MQDYAKLLTNSFSEGVGDGKPPLFNPIRRHVRQIYEETARKAAFYPLEPLANPKGVGWGLVVCAFPPVFILNVFC